MMKWNESSFNRQALQQSLLFWRGEPSADSLASPESLKLEKKVSKESGIKDDGPHPWRYVRWGKAHSKFVVSGKEKKEVKGNFYHKLLPYENLFEVAGKYETYPEVLMEANGILNPVNVATGQILWVPRTHFIQWGNTLWSLSRKYCVPICTIQKANGIVDPDLIYAGDILIIPEDPDNRNAW